MEEKLYSLFKKKFFAELICFLIVPFVALVLLIVSLLSRMDVISLRHIGDTHELLALTISVCLLVCGSLIGFRKFLLPYVRDYRLLKRKEYRVIQGIVLRYDFRNDGADPPTRLEIPVIQDTETGEIVELDLGRYLIQNACYQICFLPRCKIAVIEKRIS